MPTQTPTSTAPGDLLLDPNNFRFQDSPDFQFAAENRFHEQSVQDATFARLRERENLRDLKRSIMRNGYMPVEQIVTRPYDSVPGKYLVIEGNRRTAAVRWILQDYDSGIPVPQTVLASLQKLPTYFAEDATTDQAFRASLMGIRHVSGIKEWGGYQRARLIIMMRDDLGLEASEVAERLALTTHEVNRRYKALKTLQQLENDEDYGEHATASMYPIFHEAVSLPIVRDWLGWNEDSVAFEGRERRRFYGLITPSRDDSGEYQDPKLANRSQVRELRNILSNREAKRILLDPDGSLQRAIAVAHQDELARSWRGDVNSAAVALHNMEIAQVKSLTADDLDLLAHLSDLVSERLADHKRLVGSEGTG